LGRRRQADAAGGTATGDATIAGDGGIAAITGDAR
jgi:hypothetical protein